NHADRFIPIRGTHKVMIYNEALYNADYVNYPKTDLRLLDLDSGREEMILEKLALGSDYLKISPSSKYIAYYRNGDWWLYDLGYRRHSNLTKEIPTKWAGISRHGKDTVPYNQPTWLETDTAIVLQDEYDLWLIDLFDGFHKRITHGRENQISYKVDHHAFLDKNPFRRYHSKKLSLKEGLIVKMGNINQDKGYAVFDQNGLKQFLPLKATFFERMKETRVGHYWVQEAFNTPPELWFKESGIKKPLLIRALNTDIPKENLGSNQLIAFSNSIGDSLQGVLY